MEGNSDILVYMHGAVSSSQDKNCSHEDKDLAVNFYTEVPPSSNGRL